MTGAGDGLLVMVMFAGRRPFRIAMMATYEATVRLATWYEVESRRSADACPYPGIGVSTAEKGVISWLEPGWLLWSAEMLWKTDRMQAAALRPANAPRKAMAAEALGNTDAVPLTDAMSRPGVKVELLADWGARTHNS